MSQRIRFTADHDHTWPSRSVTAYKAGWEGTVKDEVAVGAIGAGKAEPVTETAAMAALPSNFMQLKKIARDEGIDLGAANTVPDIQAVIVAARKAKTAAPPTPPEPPVSSDAAAAQS
jgi:hypothetical protein